MTEYKAALHPAEQVVAKRGGRQDVDMAEDLLHLAGIQADLKDYNAAEISYLHAIQILEDEKGIYSPALITPYHALGRTYTESGRFDDALVALKQAQWLSKRSRGLYNTEQSALIDDMTTAYQESGRNEEARALQQGRLENAIRQFGADSPELVPFYQHFGDYYEQAGFRAYARDEFKKALEISNAHYGDASPESLEQLRRLTLVELKLNHRRYARDELLAALDKATDLGPMDRGLSLAVLGDFAIVNGDQASASSYYAEAYSALQQSGDVDADDFFATPMMLDFDPPIDFYEPKSRAWSWGSAEFAFDVSASGEASEVRMVSVEPSDDDRIEGDYSGRIRATHFRPRLEKGLPVASSDVSETYKFRYYDRH